MNKFLQSAIFSFIFATAVVAEETPDREFQPSKQEMKTQIFELLGKQTLSTPDDFVFTVEKLSDRKLICLDHKTELAVVCLEEAILRAMMKTLQDHERTTAPEPIKAS